MANWGIKVSKSGFDVGTASVENQVFNSNNNTFKILKEGVVNGTLTSSGTSVSVSVSDTFTSNTFPAFMAYMRPGTANTWYPPYGTEKDTGKNIFMDLYLDPDRLKVFADLTASSGTTVVSVYFYILVEPSVNI